jgi:Fur family zinc uptake transcriptional regulator
MKTQQLNCKLRQAKSWCTAQGARLTLQRRQVLGILLNSDRPLGAYQILDALSKDQPRIAPPTVYRALEFLQQHGLIHKLETLHAYISCSHPDHTHHSQFLICTVCGDVTELEDAEIAGSLDHAAAASGFEPSQDVVELTGYCAQCSGAES